MPGSVYIVARTIEALTSKIAQCYFRGKYRHSDRLRSRGRSDNNHEWVSWQFESDDLVDMIRYQGVEPTRC